jgi:hypothetical protein
MSSGRAGCGAGTFLRSGSSAAAVVLPDGLCYAFGMVGLLGGKWLRREQDVWTSERLYRLEACIGMIAGRLDSKSFESLKRDIEEVARRHGLRVRKFKLEGATKRTKKTKRKKK